MITRPVDDDATPRRWSPFVVVAAGVVAAAIGLLPWLVTGMRLPLQNLWATPTLPADMPIALLPFSQYAVTRLFGLVVIGYAIGGIAARATRHRHPRRTPLVVAITVLAVHVVATVQAAVVVESGLQDRTASVIYLVALLAVVLFSTLVGLLVLGLVSTSPPPGAMIGLTLAAVASGPWLGGFTALFTPISAGSEIWPLLAAIRWLPAVLVGTALAWSGIGSRGRIAAALVSLTLLWVLPAGFTAVSAAVGSRVLLPYPAELLDYGVGVFTSALFLPELALPPLLVAVAVAALGLVARRLVSRRRRVE